MAFLDSVWGMVEGNNPLVKIVLGMLGNNQVGGGLEGIVKQFQQGGLGDLVASWTGTGPNQDLSPDQVHQVLEPSGQLDQVAQQAGISKEEAASGLAQILPQLIDQLTPHGQVPQGGISNPLEMLKHLFDGSK